MWYTQVFSQFSFLPLSGKVFWALCVFGLIPQFTNQVWVPKVSEKRVDHIQCHLSHAGTPVLGSGDLQKNQKQSLSFQHNFSQVKGETIA